MRNPRRLALLWTALALACDDDGPVDPDAGTDGGELVMASCSFEPDIPEIGLPVARIEGTLRGESRNASTTCTRDTGSGGPEAVYFFRLPERRIVEMQVLSDIDTVLAIREACDDPLTEVACAQHPLELPGAGGIAGSPGSGGFVMGGFGVGGAMTPPPAAGGSSGTRAQTAPPADLPAGELPPEEDLPPGMEPLPIPDNPRDAGLRVVLEPGLYYVVIDEAEPFGVGGDFALEVRTTAPPAHSLCASALPLADGTSLPAEDLDLAGSAPVDCLGEGARPALYYAATIPSGETLDVRAVRVAGEREWTPIMQLYSACGEAGICLATSSPAGMFDSFGEQQVEYVNNGPAPVTVILAVSADSDVRGARFALRARIRAPRFHGICGRALPVTDGTLLVDEDISEAQDVPQSRCGFFGQPALYYKADLLPRQTIDVQIMPKPPFAEKFQVWMQQGCVGGQCLGSSSGFSVRHTNGDQPTSVTIVVSGGGGARQGLFDLRVSMSLPPGIITVDPTANLQTTEAGGTATFKVALSSPPSAPVSIPLQSRTPTEGTVSPSVLTFTAANWNVPQTATVTGVDDAERDGTRNYSIGVGPASSADSRYNNVRGQDVLVQNRDNEPGVTVMAPASLVTTESGGTAKFTVSLNTQPAADVRIPVRSSNPAEATVSPAALSFTPVNWNVAQTVTVTGLPDDMPDGDVKYQIIFDASLSTDASYNGVTAPALNAINVDNTFKVPSLLAFSFDEGMGTSTADLSGRNNNGEVVSGRDPAAPAAPMPVWTEGKRGQALQFSAPTWVRVADSDAIDETGINNAVSIVAWVKASMLAASQERSSIVSRHELGTKIEHFELALFQGLPQGAVHFFFATGAKAIPIGEWVHLAMTYDGITMRVYMNGEEVAFLDVGWPIAADDTPVAIGARLIDGEVIDFFDGAIDDVRLFSRQLTPNEVATLAK